jgi:hypothetical protein
VCFGADTDHELLLSETGTSCGCSMRFRSVIGTGKISFVTERSEKGEALEAIMKHYAGNASPDMESRPSREMCPRCSPPVFEPARGARSAPSGVAQRLPRATGRGQKLLRWPGLHAVRRLRRRITLIYAGCPTGQSRMTVFRRELPQSSGASPPGQSPSVA